MSIKQEIGIIEMLFWLRLDFFNPAFHFMSKAHKLYSCRCMACFSWFVWSVLSSEVYLANMICLCLGLSREPLSAIRYFWWMEYQFFTNMLIFSNDGFLCVIQLCVPYTWACPAHHWRARSPLSRCLHLAQYPAPSTSGYCLQNKQCIRFCFHSPFKIFCKMLLWIKGSFE